IGRQPLVPVLPYLFKLLLHVGTVGIKLPAFLPEGLRIADPDYVNGICLFTRSQLYFVLHRRAGVAPDGYGIRIVTSFHGDRVALVAIASYELFPVGLEAHDRQRRRHESLWFVYRPEADRVIHDIVLVAHSARVKY